MKASRQGHLLLVPLLLILFLTAESSVFFRTQRKGTTLTTTLTGRRTLSSSSSSSFYQRHQSERVRQRRLHRRNCSSSSRNVSNVLPSSSVPKMTTTATTAPLAFCPSNWLMVGGAAVTVVGYIGNLIRSEAVRRAMFFWIHAGPIVAHYKFTRWYLSKTNAPLEKRDRVYNTLHNKYCHKSLNIALNLKGLYVKLAQIVSSRPDFVPPQYIELFTSAQDSIPQWSLEDVRSVLDDTLDTDYGLKFEDVFDVMDPIALGSASIGQVHRAVLKPKYAEEFDGIEEVAVKVMHPGAEERFHHDFQVFRWLCKVALTGWETILDECYRQIMSEFDYRKEAKSLATVSRHMDESPYKNKIRIPEPFTNMCTKECLVMEMFHGKKFSDAIEDELAAVLGGDKMKAGALIKAKQMELILGRDKMEALGQTTASSLKESMSELGILSKLRLLGLYRKTKNYIDLLIDVQGHQMLFNGIFNGDPHPGNLMSLPDGRLGLIDYGQTKTISKDERLGIALVVHALGNGSDDKKIADAMRKLGFQTKLDQDETLAKYAALFFDSDIEGKKMGCATPQMYFATLTKMDPLVNVPDVAIFVARASFIIRGMGTVLEKQIRTAVRWSSQAQEALAVEKVKVANSV